MNTTEEDQIAPFKAYLSIPEAAQLMRVSERTLRSLVANRKIKAVRVRRRVILRLVDINRYMDSHAA